MAVKLTVFDNVFLEASWCWLQDEELRSLIDSQIISREQQLLWFNNLPNRTDYYIWGVLYEGLPVGVSGIKKIQDNIGEYWGYIGEKKYWGKGIGSAMIRLIEKQARVLKLTELVLYVLPNNLRAIHSYQKNGFVKTESKSSFVQMQKKL